jgi:catechol 2,3-dioxygenase-like lactoylglutathione lyase family enzyme
LADIVFIERKARILSSAVMPRAVSDSVRNVGGGPTPDKPTVTLSVPDPNHINSFMNLRVADIQACYKLWKSRGAEFITEPIPKYGEIRCYIRDPDGYIIEVGQSTTLTYG